MAVKSEEMLHWADEKEVISTNKPLLLLLVLMKRLPKSFVFVLIYPIAVFYYICSRRARTECTGYQERLKKFSNNLARRRRI